MDTVAVEAPVGVQPIVVKECPTETWVRVREALKESVGSGAFDEWLKLLKFDRIEDGQAHHTVPSRFLQVWTNRHYRETLLVCWCAEYADMTGVTVALRDCTIARLPQPAEAETTEVTADPAEKEAVTTPALHMVERIRTGVRSFYGLSMEDFLSPRREVEFVRPRQVGMYLSFQYAKQEGKKWSYNFIGKFFGGKDHATVISAIRRIEIEMPVDSTIAYAVALLSEEFGIRHY